MHHSLIILCFIFASLNIYGQVLDTAKVRVWYDVTYKQTDEEASLTKDKEVLDLGTGYSRYFNYSAYMRTEFMDSVQKANPDMQDLSSVIANENTPKSGRATCIYKNVSSDSVIVTDRLFSIAFRYTQHCSEQNWELMAGDTIISGMRCNKACLDWHGRKWQAWYTTEIPISEGPWKLCGLPGLILQAEEQSGIFSFRFSGLEHVSIPIPSFKEKKYIETTPKKFQDETKDYWHNQEEYIFIHENLPYHPGMFSQAPSFTPCLMEYY